MTHDLRDRLREAGWHVTFDAAVNERILRYGFLGITTFGSDAPLWWSSARKTWGHEHKAEPGVYISSHSPCRSFKAFVRHLRKHPELMAAREVVLVSRWVGHSIVATPLSQPATGKGETE